MRQFRMRQACFQCVDWRSSLRRGFAEMVMYIEACESGSIFQGTLDDSLKIYAVVRLANYFYHLGGGACQDIFMHIWPSHRTA